VLDCNDLDEVELSEKRRIFKSFLVNDTALISLPASDAPVRVRSPL